MDAETYHITANGVDWTFVTLTDISCSPPVNRLVTRNSLILKELGVEDYPFQHRDESTGILQVYDAITQQVIKLNFNHVDNISYHSLPEWFGPSAICVHSHLCDPQAVYSIIEPFVKTVKTVIALNGFSENKCLDQKEADRIFLFLLHLKKYKIKTRDNNLYNYILSPFHRRCNTLVSEYVKKNYDYLLLAPYLKFYPGMPKVETIEDIKDLVHNHVDLLLSKQIEYFKEEGLKQIQKYEKEFEDLCREQFAGEEYEQERDFLQLQYTKAIQDIKNINFETQLSIYGDNPLLFLRFWPIEYDRPDNKDTSKSLRFLTHFEHTVFQLLYINDIKIQKEDISFIDVETVKGEVVAQLNVRYLESLKTNRMTQIREHAEKIASTVREEIQDLEEEDILDILASIRDYDSFEERLNNIESVVGVLQYWPSILLPAPDHIRRLGTVTQEMLDKMR